MAKCKLDGMDGGRCPIDIALCRKTHCKHYTGYTNADRIRAMSDEELAEYITFHKYFSTPKSCLDWLTQPAQEEG